MGCYRHILGQNHKILFENLQILKNKIYNHFIFTSILNPNESSDDKCHKLSFLMLEIRKEMWKLKEPSDENQTDCTEFEPNPSNNRHTNSRYKIVKLTMCET
jgi:hypothetical protein